ncbi:protein phosphatase 1 regulatory subunit 3B [Onthophagus taurus]|uniref:protein phosphatase 1 regulatory subunit 3B n=1 Tax=Onthophagus taurus TaxID=166361 RepID=UPI000C20C3BA|nr:protein phosphatase 1 regulatory subunit 3B [Onthophagus taurus]
MCSIFMPTDYEMLVSHSPPVYGGCLKKYPSYGYQPTTSCKGNFTTGKKSPKMPSTTTPRRPCLVIRTELNGNDCPPPEDDLPSPTRLKKKVVFADDHGRPLTQVRIMTEPSNVPPLWSFRFLAQVTRGLNTEEFPTPEEPWEVTFSQPASDYVEFRKKLDEEKVSLENVIIKENEDAVIGTVKVSNLAFEKEVFVRSTSDNWETHQDTYCKFVPNASTNTSSAAYVLYDTFSFKLSLPPKSKRLEFCVCFKCNVDEYWDNNGNNNYVLIKKINTLHKSKSENQLLNLKSFDNDQIQKSKSYDSLYMKMDSWSQFASWTYADNSHPYW